MVVVGILLIFQDSYSPSNLEGASSTTYHGYLNRNASERMLADFVMIGIYRVHCYRL